MKSQIITRIFEMIGHPGEQSFNNLRWRWVAYRICLLQGGNPDSKAFSKSLETIQYLENDFAKMTDKQLIDIFELVVSRFYRQM